MIRNLTYILIYFCFSFILLGANNKNEIITKEIISTEQKNKLTPDHLTKILKEKSKINNFEFIEAKKNNDEIYLESTKSETIKKIIFTPEHLEKKYFSQIIKKYLNSKHFPQKIQEVKDNIINILSSKGYFYPEVTIKFEKKGKEVFYSINIELNYYCYLRNIKSKSFNASIIDLFIQTGNSCIESDIDNKIKKMEEYFKNKGYKNISIDKNLVYSKNNKFVSLLIEGSLGKKHTYSIKETKDTGLLNYIFYLPLINKINESTTNDLNRKYEIKKFYNSNGYLDCKINEIKRNESEKKINFEYIVTPGPRYKINLINFQDKDYSILEYINLDGIKSKKTIINLDDIENRVANAISKLRENGFWNANFKFRIKNKDPEKELLDILFSLTKGRKRVFGNLSIVGSKLVSSEDIISKFELNKNKEISQKKIEEINDYIKKHLYNKGFIDSKINLLLNQKDKNTDEIKCDITFEIIEHTFYKLNEISIEGLNKTKESVVWNNITLKKGDVFLPEEIFNIKSNLLRLGIFNSVQIRTNKISSILSKKNKIDIKIIVNEGKHGNIAFGPGYNIDRGFIYNTIFNYKNIWGLAHEIQFRSEVSQQKNQKAIQDTKVKKTFIGRKVGLSYIYPNLMRTPIVGTTTIYHEGKADTIWNISNSINLALNYHFQRSIQNNKITGYYNIKSSYDFGSNQQKLNLVTTGETEISSVGLKIELEKIDTPKWPTSGYFLELDTSIASQHLGGQFSFLRWVANLGFFYSITKSLVFANSFSFGEYLNIERPREPTKINLLPSSERFRIGRHDKIRGFKFQPGPSIKTLGNNRIDRIGGNKYSIIKLELRQRISNSLGISIYSDIGNTFFTEEEEEKFINYYKQTGNNAQLVGNYKYNFNDFINSPNKIIENSYISSGLSFNFLIPVGSINFGVAWPIQEPCEKYNSCLGTRSEKFIEKAKIEVHVGTKF